MNWFAVKCIGRSGKAFETLRYLLPRSTLGDASSGGNGGGRSPCKPVSRSEFPGNRENNRESGRFVSVLGVRWSEKSRRISGLRWEFPKRKNRELFSINRELSNANNEFL